MQDSVDKIQAILALESNTSMEHLTRGLKWAIDNENA